MKKCEKISPDRQYPLMLRLMVGKKSQTEGQCLIHRSLIVLVYVNDQALLLTAAACTAEVTKLRLDLGQAEEELGLVKRQLEENKGK